VSFPAFFDTNVLYGALLNDLILELADRGLFRPLWSQDIMFELGKNLVKNGEDPALVRSVSARWSAISSMRWSSVMTTSFRA
jgi:hypothetical protein